MNYSDDEFWGCVYFKSMYLPVILLAAEDTTAEINYELDLTSLWEDTCDLDPKILLHDVAEVELDDWSHQLMESMCETLEALHIPYDANFMETTRYYRYEPETRYGEFTKTLLDYPTVELHKLLRLKKESTEQMLRYIENERVANEPPQPIEDIPVRRAEVDQAAVTYALTGGAS